MIKLIIDGIEVKPDPQRTVLEVAREAGIHIPTLCYHKSLTACGACRICMVEAIWKGKSSLKTACTFPAWEGEIRTRSAPVIRMRKSILELMLAAAPASEEIRQLAGEYGIEKTRFKVREEKETEKCILCGLCVRMCREKMDRSAIAFAGRGPRRAVMSPFGEPTRVCQTCGACDFVCPAGKLVMPEASQRTPEPIPYEYNAALNSRPAVHIPYPQAVPNTAVIDERYCAHLLHGQCGICRDVCEAEAIDFKQTPADNTLNVGAVILAPGYRVFEAERKKEYGYTDSANVVTSLEFERILSPSGPFTGKVLRPSDNKPPRNIAFLQCVGSRDVNTNEHCSAVCCMYAIKEAIIAKEHAPETEAAIFFMDIRAYGKGFEGYYQRAKEEHSVRFVRARVSEIKEKAETGTLLLKYTSPDDTVKEEEFDLVVLSVGLQPPEKVREISEKCGIKLNEHDFCHSNLFTPVDSSREGIFIAGPFAEPKDIPETVMQASGAAARTLSLLKTGRGTLVEHKEYPAEKDTAGQDVRIGVFVCHCGTNIAGVVDVTSVAKYAMSLPGVVYAEENIYACSNDSQERIKEIIHQHDLNRVVVASCTPRTHEPLFRNTLREAGLNPYLFELANIRDQCSWVHMNDPAGATAKSRDLVRMAAARARLLTPLQKTEIPVTKAALVIGGGLAGMTAALELAEQDFAVYLVEREEHLGGTLRRLRYLIDGSSPAAALESLVQKVEANNRIHVFTGAGIEKSSGFVGNFSSVIAHNDGTEQTVEHGVAIVATGAREHQPREYLYGQDDRVVTQLELEEKLAGGELQPSSLQTVVMIQCVGSRDNERPYCSRVCCSQAVKNALKLKELNPALAVYILYRDMRTYGFREDYYKKAQEQGVTFLRYEEDENPAVTGEGGTLTVTVNDPFLGAPVALSPDLVVLSAGTEASKDNTATAQLFKVPLNSDGFFLEAHMKLRPVDFANDGIFLCGTAHAPKSVEETIAQAQAAVGRASTILNKDTLLAEGAVAVVQDESRCRGCEKCLDACEFNAIEMIEVLDGVKTTDGVKISRINPSMCKGCGACAALCQAGAITALHFDRPQINAMIEAAFVDQGPGPAEKSSGGPDPEREDTP